MYGPFMAASDGGEFGEESEEVECLQNRLAEFRGRMLL